MDITLKYYEEYAEKFFKETVEIDMRTFYDIFEQYLLSGSSILDLGCGSGRDSKYFLNKGYRVISIDGSPRMCKLASEFIGKEVQCKKFNEICYKNEFDGIWASASLLHVPKRDLKLIFRLLYKALKDNGYMYVSFKSGEYEGEIDGKYYTYLSCSDLFNLIDGEFEIVAKMKTKDLRLESYNNKWVNIILKKISKNEIMCGNRVLS